MSKEKVPVNAGRPWTRYDIDTAVENFGDGYSVEQIAEEFGRTTGSIESLLSREIPGYQTPYQQHLGRLRRPAITKDPSEEFISANLMTNLTNSQTGRVDYEKTSTKAHREEITMSQKAFETKTFIFGTDTTDVSDEKIYAHISDLEAQVRKLEAIGHKPDSLVKKIESLNDDIIKLVVFSNERTKSAAG